MKLGVIHSTHLNAWSNLNNVCFGKMSHLQKAVNCYCFVYETTITKSPEYKESCVSDFIATINIKAHLGARGLVAEKCQRTNDPNKIFVFRLWMTAASFFLDARSSHRFVPVRASSQFVASTTPLDSLTRFNVPV